MAKIILTKNDEVLQELTLNKERVTIGRRPHNDVVIDHRAISAEHAAIITILNDSFLEDLNSTNGTAVNGQPVRKHFLQHNDIVEMARYQMRYVTDTPSADNAADADKNQAIKSTDGSQAHSVDLLQSLSSYQPTAIPAAKIKVLNGASAGTELLLNKALITMGRPGVQVAVVTRRAHGYFITHVEGDGYPLVNGVSIGAGAHPLKDGDLIDLSGTEMMFAVAE